MVARIEGLPEQEFALVLLREFHLARNSRPVADTIERLLAATRAHGGFVLLPSGQQALANVLHLAELARQYEASGAISFRGFVEQLCEDAERGEAPQAPILEEGSEGVRLMTVHKAKGLEFRGSSWPISRPSRRAAGALAISTRAAAIAAATGCEARAVLMRV